MADKFEGEHVTRMSMQEVYEAIGFEDEDRNPVCSECGTEILEPLNNPVVVGADWWCHKCAGATPADFGLVEDNT